VSGGGGAATVVNLFGGYYEFLLVFYTFREANRRITLKIHCYVRVSECKGISYDGIRPAALTANP